MRTASSAVRPHLLWVFGDSPTKLDAATWLDTTRELRRLGWRVTLVSAGPGGQQPVRGVEVVCLPMPRVYLLKQAIYHAQVLLLIARQWRAIDVILFHQMAAPWLLPLRLVRHLAGRRRPLLAMDTRTVSMLPRSREKWKDRLRRVYAGLMESAANRWADGRLAITQRMAEAVHMRPDRLWGVWPSGVDVDLFSAARETRRWPEPSEPVHLIYIGVLHYERNLMTLCRAVEQANEEGMSLVLSLVGDGLARADLEGFAKGTAGRVRVVAPVPHDRIPEVLARAHVGVLAFPDELKFQVSSPIKLFEYLAAGLPVLSTRVACATDVLGGADCVFWADRSDVEGLLPALRRVWKNRSSFRELGRQAADISLRWTWQGSAVKLKEALEYGLDGH